MARYKKWQRGSADLVSVAVGMVILSIAAAGTAASMIYSKEVLGRQERYKVAAYLLRQEMEKKLWEIQTFRYARSDAAVQSSSFETELSTSDDRVGGSQKIYVELAMDPILQVPDPDLPSVIAYFVVTMHARWEEPEMAGGRNSRRFQSRHITYRTAIDNRL